MARCALAVVAPGPRREVESTMPITPRPGWHPFDQVYLRHTIAIYSVVDSATDAMGTPIEQTAPIAGFEAQRCLVSELSSQDRFDNGIEQNTKAYWIFMTSPAPIYAGTMLGWVDPQTGAPLLLRAKNRVNEEDGRGVAWIVLATLYEG
jgi:hypothetical protein